MSTSKKFTADKVIGKCDARGCGSPATVTSRFGGRFCSGHSYLAEPREALAGDGE